MPLDFDGSTILQGPSMTTEPTASQGYYAPIYFERYNADVIKNIDTIPLNKTIEMFQDLNDILILFYEKPDACSKNCTKRVYLSKHNAQKKTLRKTA